MTQTHDQPGAEQLLGTPNEARRDAELAAEGAHVDVVEPPEDRPEDVQELIGAVWGAQQQPQDNLVRALRHAGTALLVALRDDGCVGVSLGFVGWNGGLHLHSHMTAVRPGLEAKGVGFALKLWQRSLCLDHGVHEIRWTFDPLIARNAHFNLVKLGATVRRFLPDHYGEMDDTVNAGDRSDRFEVSWQLGSDRVTQALTGTLPDPGDGTLVAIPADYDRMRREDPDAARHVRQQARRAFAELGGRGLVPTWSPGGYLFTSGSRHDGADMADRT